MLICINLLNNYLKVIRAITDRYEQLLATFGLTIISLYSFSVLITENMPFMFDKKVYNNDTKTWELE
jgi:hypothetical protein